MKLRALVIAIAAQKNTHTHTHTRKQENLAQKSSTPPPPYMTIKKQKKKPERAASVHTPGRNVNLRYPNENNRCRSNVNTRRDKAAA